MTIGEIIQARRKAARLTQRQLGEAIGKKGRSAETTVQKWEHGLQTPNVSQLRPLCRALNCTLEQLVPLD